MDRSILRHTKSLSPLTLKEVDAQVILEKGQVFLEKKDEKGKQYKTLIERNYDYYREMASEVVPDQVSPNALFLYVSSTCNLQCPICYENKKLSKEPSLDEIEDILKDHKNKLVALLGREPTCRGDFPEIVKIASRHNRTCVLTNGIKFADYNYALKLKEAGLDSISLSFNGFDDEIYQKMNGKPLLDIKLKALENIKKVGIKTVISLTIAWGVNENQVRKICDYCFENRDFIYELRIRAASPVGRHIELKSYCMTEMFDLMADQLQIGNDAIIKQQAFWHECLKQFGPLIPHSVRAFYRKRVCSSSFHLRKNGSYSCLAGDFDHEAYKKSHYKKMRLIFHMIKSYGLTYILQNVSFLFKLPFKFDNTQNMMVVLKCWPHLYNIDLLENRKCPSQYYKDGKFIPFCLCNIITDFQSDTEHEN